MANNVKMFLQRLEALDPGLLHDATSAPTPAIATGAIPDTLSVADLIPPTVDQDVMHMEVRW